MCKTCRNKLRGVGYTDTYRAKLAASLEPSAGMSCQQCANHEVYIASLQTEVHRLRALLEGICDECYAKLHPNLDNIAGEEMVISAPAVSMSNASQAVLPVTTGATASTLSTHPGTSSASYTLPTGTFGNSAVQHTSMMPASAVSDYPMLSESYDIRIEIRQLHELCGQTGYIANVLENASFISVENPLPIYPVDISTAIHLDGLFGGAFYLGYMFRVLESFYYFAQYLPGMHGYAYLRYVKPSNIVLLHDSFPKKAYYSKLSKSYYGHFEPQQYREIPHLPHAAIQAAPIPPADAHYVAPEVANGHPFDVHKAVAFSVGVCLYETFTVALGMKHVITTDAKQQHFIVEGTLIRHPDGSFSRGLYSVNPAIIDVIASLLQTDPEKRGTLGDFTELFTPISAVQMDTTITGAKPLKDGLKTLDVCWLRAPPATTTTPTISYTCL